MNRATRRLLACSPFNAAFETSLMPGLSFFQSRTFSQTFGRGADEKELEGTATPPTSTSNSIFANTSSPPSKPSLPKAPQSSSKGSNLRDLATIWGKKQANRSHDPFLDISRLSSIGATPLIQESRFEEPHHFHIYATRHNTHITLTKPNRDPLISVSAGNIGFRKSARKHYDSAFQLAGYVMGRIQEQGLNSEIKKLEVTLRGYGVGREAVTKALLGYEGRLLKGKVVKVSDATRLKFGGTRSKKPRRLG